MPNTLAAQYQRVVASDGSANAWFGTSLAVYGDTAVIGAPNATVNGQTSQGIVYIFTRSGGHWTQAQKLVANDGAAGDHFGQTAALLNGKTLVITAPLAKVNGRVWEGAAYVFDLVGGSWKQKQKLTPSDGIQYGTFGKSVALNANHLLIGAGGALTNNVHVRGSVYVFNFVPSKAGGAWTQVQRILAPDQNDDTAFFGNSVAMYNDTAMVGAYASTIGGNLGQGAAYVYGIVGGEWKMTAKLIANDGGPRENFGISIGFQGTTAFIGAPGVTNNGNVSQGAVYRFERSGSVWTQSQKLTASNGGLTNFFGASVSYVGSHVLIGAYGANSYQGTAYVFGPSSGAWAQRRELTVSSVQAGGVFGYYTALDARTALVSAYAEDVGGNADQGAAYFFPLGPGGPSPTA